jgi:hypothetical protein
MDATQRAIHRATAIDGDSYALIEWDAEADRPRIHHERAYDGSEGVKVTYATSGRREIAFASKRWRQVEPMTGKTWKRLNIYTPTEIYKYRTGSDSDYGWAAYQDEADGVWPLPWSVGRVPVVPFRYDDDGGEWGLSELDGLIPLQNALNKAWLDLIAAAASDLLQGVYEVARLQCRYYEVLKIGCSASDVIESRARLRLQRFKDSIASSPSDADRSIIATGAIDRHLKQHQPILIDNFVYYKIKI